MQRLVEVRESHTTAQANTRAYACTQLKYTCTLHKLTAVQVVDLQGLRMYKEESRGSIARKMERKQREREL